MQWPTIYVVFVLIILVLALRGIVRFLRRPGKPRKIIVPLEDLSHIWLKYNEDFEPQPLGREDGVSALFDGAGKAGRVIDKGQGERHDERKAPVKTVPRDTPLPSSPREQAGGLSFAAGPLEAGALASLTRLVKPFEEVFEAQGVTDLTRSIVGVLERHSLCPSIVLDSKDQEAVDLYTIRDSLAKVTLRDHSYTVAEIIVETLKETYLDYEDQVPKAVITALAHDLGKIPEFRDSGIYNTREHPFISAVKLREMAGEPPVFWLEDALKAIKDHHLPSKDDLTNLLKQADKRARELELLSFTSTYSVIPFDQWFEPEKLFRLIEPHINRLWSGRKWKALSYKGVVYCFPDFLYEKAKELCKEARALDLTFIYESEREAGLRKVVGALKEGGFVLDTVPLNRHAAMFEIRSAVAKKRFMLTPIRGDCFDLEAAESNKVGYLTSVREVRRV